MWYQSTSRVRRLSDVEVSFPDGDNVCYIVLSEVLLLEPCLIFPICLVTPFCGPSWLYKAIFELRVTQKNVYPRWHPIPGILSVPHPSPQEFPPARSTIVGCGELRVARLQPLLFLEISSRSRTSSQTPTCQEEARHLTSQRKQAFRYQSQSIYPSRSFGLKWTGCEQNTELR